MKRILFLLVALCALGTDVKSHRCTKGLLEGWFGA